MIANTEIDLKDLRFSYVINLSFTNNIDDATIFWPNNLENENEATLSKQTLYVA